jgi:TonB family protein
MKSLCVIFSLSFCNSFSQGLEKEFYNQYHELSDANSGYYYIVGKKSPLGVFSDSVKSYYSKSKKLRSVEIYDRFGSPKGYYHTFYPNGKPKSSGRYEKKNFAALDPPRDSIDTFILQFNDSLGLVRVKNGAGFVNGRLHCLVELGNVVNGLRDSVWTTLHNNGKVYSHESWVHGNFVDGISYDVSGKEYYYKDLLVLPEPQEGMTNFFDQLSDRIDYPKEAEKRGIEGKIIIEFTVEKDGKIKSPRVVKGIGFGCDEEAVKALKASPAWKPGVRKGQPSNYKMTVPFLFKLT